MSGLPSPGWGEVTIAGVSLHRAAWQALNSHVLLDPAPKRRTNRLIPGAPGRRGRRGWPDQRSVELDVYVLGTFDPDGDPTDDPIEGVEANVDYLRENVYGATEDAFGCVEGSVLRRDGGLWTFDVQVDDMVVEPGIASRVVTFSLTIPKPATFAGS